VSGTARDYEARLIGDPGPVIVKGELPDGGRAKDFKDREHHGIALYDAAGNHYLTMTGERIAGNGIRNQNYGKKPGVGTRDSRLKADRERFCFCELGGCVQVHVQRVDQSRRLAVAQRPCAEFRRSETYEAELFFRPE
jgi:hypothetical protein